MRARSLSLWAASALLLSVSVAGGAQSRDAAAAQSKGIDPALLAKAKAGDAAAEFHVGFDYQQGKGVPQNYARAAVWYRKAAEQGNADAQSILGTLYHKGQGVPQDYAQAALWWRKAAEQGNVFAQGFLGSACERGRGMPQDFTQAALWYRKAAEQGEEDAENSLGLLYEDGKGVPQDYSEAYFWTNLATATMDSSYDGGQLYTDFVKDRDRIAAHLTNSELLKVQERTRVWFAAHQPKKQ
jgi:TPR repeat protein